MTVFNNQVAKISENLTISSYKQGHEGLSIFCFLSNPVFQTLLV